MQQMQHAVRLSKDIRPINYKLNLTPNLKSLSFVGELTTKIQVLNPTNIITFHGFNLKLDRIYLKSSTNFCKDVSYFPVEEIIVLSFKDILVIGEYDLCVFYSGKINLKSCGLYKIGDDCLATLFVPNYARRCFPCWDEPSFKANFDMSVVIDRDLLVLSNMPLKYNEQESSGKLRHIFHTTPIMSTYLLALCIGKYDFVENYTGEIRVFTPRGKRYQGVFAADIADKVLKYFNKYLNIDYELPKLDLITVENFQYEAMENWGLIMFKETSLLIDPKLTPTSQKLKTALLIAHELAHQWFGNLVTMEWWNCLWLNEGFATFMQYQWFNVQFPFYNIWTHFYQNIKIKALNADFFDSSHSLNEDLEQDQILSRFDDITYKKGACVLQMCHDFIGDERFRRKVKRYLARHQHSNVKDSDLWKSFNLTDIMGSWCNQKGFPLVDVNFETIGDDLVLILQQKKFQEGFSTDIWSIPINIMISDKSQGKQVIITLMDQRRIQITIPKCAKFDWMVVNHKAVGFFRVQYSNKVLEKLCYVIRKKKIAVVDRISILDDMFALVKLGVKTLYDFLYFLTVFDSETDYNVVVYILNILDQVRRILSSKELDTLFNNKFQLKFLRAIILNIGWDPNSNEEKWYSIIRELIIERLALLGDQEVLKISRLKLYKNPDVLLHWKSACYINIIISDDQENYELFQNLYNKTITREDKHRLIIVLAASRNSSKLQDLLSNCLKDYINPNEAALILVSLASSPMGLNLSWNYIKKYSTKIQEKLGSHLFNRMLLSLTESLTDSEISLDIKQFFQKHTIPDTKRTIQQIMEITRINQRILSRDVNMVKEFLLLY